MRTATQDEFVEHVREVVERLPEGEWILGGLWGAYDRWAAGSAGGEQREPFTPDLGGVAGLTQAHPMFIRKFDGSIFAANAAALEAGGLDPDVEFERDLLTTPPAEILRARVLSTLVDGRIVYRAE